MGCHGEVAFADVPVDGLGTDKHHRLAVRAQSLERVEQDATGCDVGGIKV